MGLAGRKEVQRGSLQGASLLGRIASLEPVRKPRDKPEVLIYRTLTIRNLASYSLLRCLRSQRA